MFFSVVVSCFSGDPGIHVAQVVGSGSSLHFSKIGDYRSQSFSHRVDPKKLWYADENSNSINKCDFTGTNNEQVLSWPSSKFILPMPGADLRGHPSLFFFFFFFFQKQDRAPLFLQRQGARICVGIQAQKLFLSKSVCVLRIPGFALYAI